MVAQGRGGDIPDRVSNRENTPATFRKLHAVSDGYRREVRGNVVCKGGREG